MIASAPGPEAIDAVTRLLNHVNGWYKAAPEVWTGVAVLIGLWILAWGYRGRQPKG